MSTHDTLHTASAPSLRQISSLGTLLLILVGFLLLIFTHHNVIQTLGAVMLLLALITPALGKAMRSEGRTTDESIVLLPQEALERLLRRALPASGVRNYLQFVDDLITPLLREELSREDLVERVHSRAMGYLRQYTRLSFEVIDAITEQTVMLAMYRFDAVERAQTSVRTRETQHRSNPGHPGEVMRSPRH